ncbi:MAG: chemotaxis protein CheW [Rhodocyclales bacterium]|nr:chemotaxis protein CheW [Rhodocyclales bacterium]
MDADDLNSRPITLDEALAARQAHAETHTEEAENLLKLVIFELAGERFACHGERIREIIFQAEVYFVPGCPDSLEGVINVRGDITSVIRLNDLLGLPQAPGGHRRSSILLGHGNGMDSGIRVGQVIDVVDIPESEIHPSPANLPEHLRLRMPGILYFAGQAVTLLDLDRLFADYAKGLG